MARSKLLPKRRRRNPSATERLTGGVILLLTAGIVGLVMSGGSGQGPAGFPEPPKPPGAGATDGTLPLKSAAGWPRGEVEIYNVETVFEKINGKADIYHEFDFTELRCASYSDPKDPSRYVDVYVYDQDRPENALGIYRVQRSGAERAIPGGDEACASGASAFARRGRYYIEVIGSGDEAVAEVVGLVAPIAESLGDGGGKAVIPDWFPEAGRTRVAFALRNALGVSALRNAWIASYPNDVKVFVAEYDDAAGAGAAVTEAADEFEFFGTPVHLTAVGARVVGVAGLADAAKAKALADVAVKKLGEPE